MLQLSLALDALHEPLAFWVHYNDPQAKRELLERYEALPARQRAALEQAVERSFQGPTLTAYRRTKPGDRPQERGGMSVSTDRPAYMTAFETFELRPEDVLLHWAVTYPSGEATALGGRAFGHEHEVILRPGARPRRIGSGHAELREQVDDAEFFHVTSSANRELIRKRGLSPSRGWISGPGVFVTTNPHSWLFMFEDSGIYSDAPAVDIWAVDVSGLELVPDDNETADPDQDFRVVEAIIPASRVRLVETIE